MSDEQQQIAIGRTVQEYAASKAKLAALQGEANKLSSKLAQVSGGLASSGKLSSPDPGNLLAFMDQNIGGFPSADAVLSLVREISGELDRKYRLNAQLKNMGIEPKD
jgi:hypothetical protein